MRYGNPLFHAEDLFKNIDFAMVREIIDSPDGYLRGIRVPGACELSRKILDEISAEFIASGGKALFWIKNSTTGISSSIKKILTDQVTGSILQRAGAGIGDLILLGLAKGPKSLQNLGQMRINLAQRLQWKFSDRFRFLWVVDFPLFEFDPDRNAYNAAHHPFTYPHEADFPLLETDPSKVRANSYDLVLNGVELGSGSIRIHRKDIQSKVFSILGISDAEAEEKFGFFLEALQYGAPPHGGIALGLDRFMMILADATSLRDVMAFPKSTRGNCLLTGSPSRVAAEQLKELHLKLDL
jgi:aspartyl-tRNA synthetase